jgi:hypothetical protein
MWQPARRKSAKSSAELPQSTFFEEEDPEARDGGTIVVRFGKGSRL